MDLEKSQKYISNEEYSKYEKFQLIKGDIVCACSGGSWGKSAIYNIQKHNIILNTSTLRLRFFNDLGENLFLYYLTKSDFFKKQLEVQLSGMQPNFGYAHYSKVFIPIPPLDEQKRITRKLEEVIPCVDKYNKIQENLNLLNYSIYEVIKKSILQEAIQGKLVPQMAEEGTANELLEQIRLEKQRLFKEGKLKKSALTNSIIYKGDDNKYYENDGKNIVCIDDEIPFDIPASWRWSRIKDLFIINPKNHCPDNIDSAFIPMEKIEATYDSIYTYDTVKWGTIKKGFTHFSNGDVAFAKITPCFQNKKSAIFNNLPNGIGAGTTELKVLRQYGETINRWYLLYFLETPYFIDEAEFKGTANQQRIISGYLENKLFPLPPLREQTRIVERIKSLTSIMSR